MKRLSSSSSSSFSFSSSRSFLLLATPVIISATYHYVTKTEFTWPINSLLVIFLYILVRNSLTKSNIEEKEARYNWITNETSAQVIVKQLETNLVGDRGGDGDKDEDEEFVRNLSQVTLSALFSQWNKRQALINMNKPDKTQEPQHDARFILICFKSSFLIMEYYYLNKIPMDNELLSLTIYLLAIIARQSIVVEVLQTSESYDVSIPISLLKNALTSAKETTNEEEEQICAELQRRGCLFIGALTDTSPAIATKLLQETEALEVVLMSLDWFRYHELVGSWGLWALFCFVFNNSDAKKALLKERKAFKIVCQVMKCLPEALEVQRHGVAILFDVLRFVAEENSEQVPDRETSSQNQEYLIKIRMMALNAGLHDVLSKAMKQFDTHKEIVMMSKEMLTATGYQISP